MSHAFFHSVVHKLYQKAPCLKVHNVFYQNELVKASFINARQDRRNAVKIDFEKILTRTTTFEVCKATSILLKGGSETERAYQTLNSLFISESLGKKLAPHKDTRNREWSALKYPLVVKFKA